MARIFFAGMPLTVAPPEAEKPENAKPDAAEDAAQPDDTKAAAESTGE
jgi:hypothetical protein